MHANFITESQERWVRISANLITGPTTYAAIGGAEQKMLVFGYATGSAARAAPRGGGGICGKRRATPLRSV